MKPNIRPSVMKKDVTVIREETDEFTEDEIYGEEESERKFNNKQQRGYRTQNHQNNKSAIVIDNDDY